ncbi:Chitobiosyldiphosphodolichol beta-mannosyltransferase [Nymphon striatum]|nr:Chitobiosyldiphosphodolichol beta-mannosyltransferase [Nymphon striatum]
MRRVCVAVLGDIGRSPRMQYHALSLAKEGYFVNLLGYEGSKPLSELLGHQNTPPAVPTLTTIWLVKSLRRCKVIIDWHNYGFSILSLKMKATHPLVKFYRWLEQVFGKKSDHNLCVTSAMKADLSDNWGLKNISVLYDRPAEIYKSVVEVEEVHNLFLRLQEEYSVFKGAADADCTAFTENVDEDFFILLSALQKYDHYVDNNDEFPDVICTVTGKGPLKQFYCNLFEEKPLKHVKFCTPWLSSEDYALVLGCSDLGVCLHFSSSGLDLPMKVVDMFGCRLPVCAIDFSCISELVKHNENGLIFKNSDELYHHLILLLNEFPQKTKLNQFRENLKSFQEVKWHKSWKKNCNHTELRIWKLGHSNHLNSQRCINGYQYACTGKVILQQTGILPRGSVKTQSLHAKKPDLSTG